MIDEDLVFKALADTSRRFLLDLLFKRDGQTLVPERRTVLKHGDDLLVVTPRRSRQKTEARLRQVSAGGRLAQWLG